MQNMETDADNGKINAKLAQFKHALDSNMFQFGYDMEWIVQKLGNINSQVVATNYLQVNHAEWIGYTALHFAVDKGDSSAIDVLLKHDSDPTIQNSRNSTALHRIIEGRAYSISSDYRLDSPDVHSILSAHLKHNNFQNPMNNSGLSHFHIACADNYTELVKGFLGSGVSVNHTVKMDSSMFAGFSPLHFAVFFCAFEVVDLLLSHGANVRNKDVKNMMPLHVALEKELKIISGTHSSETVRDTNEKILQLLLDKEKNNSAATIDDWGLSHLHVSCTLKDSKIAEHFLQNNKNINSVVSMNSPLWPGYTALHFAALCNINTVKLLMKRGADINIKNAKGLTPFDFCIESCTPRDIHTIISLHSAWRNTTLTDGKTKLTDLVFAMRDTRQFKLFLKKLSKNFSIGDSPVWSGYSPMHLAVIFTRINAKESVEVNVEILKILCKQCPSMLYSQDIHGYTPLHLAFRLNKKPVLELLMGILQGCSDLIDRVDEDRLSYLHIASAQNNNILLKRLLTMGINVNATFEGTTSSIIPNTCPGSTALHFAVLNDSTEAVETLMAFGANLYVKNARDMTPIHTVLLGATRNKKIGNILLESPNIEDSVVNGISLSHLHVACYCDNREAVKCLLKNGADVNGIISCKPNANEESIESFYLRMQNGKSPLLVACDNHSYTTIRSLLEHGADVFIEYATADKDTAFLSKAFESFHRNVYFDIYRDVLNESIEFQTRFKSKTGMTSLHLACFFSDVKLVEKLICEGADVNAQISPGSPIFQECTPLHVLVQLLAGYADEDHVHKIIKLLVEAGADVAMLSGKSETAVHIAYKYLHMESTEEDHSSINMMLEAQRDFSLNPASPDGITHFHIACNTCNTTVIEEFLSHCDIDINRPTDYFSNEEPGNSPLHLAASSDESIVGLSKRLKTLDLLMNRGADVQAESTWGDTPMHKCTYFYKDSLDLFERLARSAVDVNARNMEGNTPLYNYVRTNDKVSVEGIKTMLRFGCRLNTHSPVTERGFFSASVSVLSYEDAQNLISAIPVNFKHEMELDHLRRTIIHNAVSNRPKKMFTDEYATLIEQITSEMNCDVDDQDVLGRTALHIAANYQNFQAVSVLLMNGADINIVDNNDRTAFAYDLTSRLRRKLHDAEKKFSKYVFDDDKSLRTLEALAVHVKKLQLCGLDVCISNEVFAFEAFENNEGEITLPEGFSKELERAKRTKIEPHSLAIYDFLSETGAVAAYPTMSLMKRSDVRKFFSPSEFGETRDRFPELAGILQLQYRKARARSELVELAQNALAVHAGFALPEIFSDFIFIFLKNSELKSLIESTA